MKKIEGTDKILYFLIIALVLFGCFIFVNQKYGLLGNKYDWSNGATTFTVYKTKIGKVDFYKINIFFETGNEYYPLTLRYGPKEVDDIPLSGKANEILSNDRVVYLTVPPTPDYTIRTVIGKSEVEEVLGSEYFYNKEVISTVTEEYKDRTVKSCADATPMSSVVWFKLGDTTEVYTEGDCVIVQGTTEDEIVRASDRLVLHLLGISP